MGVTDVSPDAAEQLASRHRVTPYDTIDSLLADSSAEALIVSTPPAAHSAAAMAALKRGLPVLCEKPLAPTPAAAFQLVTAAEKAGLTLATGFNQRFFPAVAALRQMVASGELGPLLYVKAYTGHRGGTEFREPWMHDPEAIGGGTLMDNGIHIVDLVHHILGDVARVEGRLSPPDAPAESDAFATFTSSAGVPAQLHSSWTAWRGYRFWIEVYGEAATACASYSPMRLSYVPRDRRGFLSGRRERFYASMYVREKLRGWQSSVRHAFAQEHDAFAARVAGQPAPTLATGAEGLRAVEIAHAVYRSAAEGQTIHLPPMA